MTIVDSFENGTSSDSHAEDSALLGISPNEPISEASLTSRFLSDQKKQKSSSKQHGFTTLMQADAFVGDNYHSNDDEYDPPLPMIRRPRSGSEGLDCLAALAEQERSRLISSSSDEEEDAAVAMPPPPCRRPRSVSNPEGMDQYQSKQQFRLAIPESILEEELAEASRAVQNAERPDILLKNARARLIEDVALEKGLPHTLSKYKNIYNRDGRIGIYTPRERAAILARYRDKRTRRNWNKKIRYNCRKSLADRRVRVKGRFVKRSEQEALLLLNHQNKEQQQDSVDEDYDGEEEEEDDDMPDVNDPEAGFCPTEDQPYRRFRRHTIT